MGLHNHKRTTSMIKTDSSSATQVTKNLVLHARMKHIEIDHHLVWEKVMAKTIKVEQISTKDNLADMMTKDLPKPLFLNLIDWLPLMDIHGPSYHNGMIEDHLHYEGGC